MKDINKGEIKYVRFIKEQSRLKGVHRPIRGVRLLYKMVIFIVHLKVL